MTKLIVVVGLGYGSHCYGWVGYGFAAQRDGPVGGGLWGLRHDGLHLGFRYYCLLACRRACVETRISALTSGVTAPTGKQRKNTKANMVLVASKRTTAKRSRRLFCSWRWRYGGCGGLAPRLQQRGMQPCSCTGTGFPVLPGDGRSEEI